MSPESLEELKATIKAKFGYDLPTSDIREIAEKLLSYFETLKEIDNGSN